MESKESLSCEQNHGNGSYTETANPVHSITYSFQNQSNTVPSMLIAYTTCGFFRIVFQSNVHASVCATYPAHLNRLNLIAEDFISLEVHLFFFSNIHT